MEVSSGFSPTSADDEIASLSVTCEASEETADELSDEVGEDEFCDALLSVDVVVDELPVLTLVVVFSLLTSDPALLTPDVAEEVGT